MKLRTLLFTVLLGLGVLAPVTSAKAEHYSNRTRVTYDHCGRPVYWEYRYVGRDCHGYPKYRWVQVSRCAPSYGGGGYHHHGSYRSHHAPRYSDSCRTGGVTLRFGW